MWSKRNEKERAQCEREYEKKGVNQSKISNKFFHNIIQYPITAIYRKKWARARENKCERVTRHIKREKSIDRVAFFCKCCKKKFSPFLQVPMIMKSKDKKVVFERISSSLSRSLSIGNFLSFSQSNISSESNTSALIRRSSCAKYICTRFFLWFIIELLHIHNIFSRYVWKRAFCTRVEREVVLNDFDRMRMNKKTSNCSYWGVAVFSLSLSPYIFYYYFIQLFSLLVLVCLGGTQLLLFLFCTIFSFFCVSIHNSSLCAVLFLLLSDTAIGERERWSNNDSRFNAKISLFFFYFFIDLFLFVCEKISFVWAFTVCDSILFLFMFVCCMKFIYFFQFHTIILCFSHEKK